MRRRPVNGNGGERLRRYMAWHRYAGLGAAVFLVWLAVTGLLLNHGHGLGLDRHYVRSGWLLDWYGIQVPEITAYAGAGHWLAEAGGTLYFDGRPAAAASGPLVGTATGGGLVAAVFPDGLVLFTPAGELVERAPVPAGIPQPLTGAGTVGNESAVASGSRVWVTGPDWLEWRPLDGTPPAGWRSAPGHLPPAQGRAVAQAARGNVLTWERVLADLHSGRFAGRAGPWVMDLAAAVLVLLVVTGAVVWYRRRGAGRR